MDVKDKHDELATKTINSWPEWKREIARQWCKGKAMAIVNHTNELVGTSVEKGK